MSRYWKGYNGSFFNEINVRGDSSVFTDMGDILPL